MSRDSIVYSYRDSISGVSEIEEVLPDSTGLPVTPDSSLTASPAEQMRFNLIFSSMMYWYGEATLLHKTVLERENTIKVYEEVTGIQARSEELIRDAYELKNSVNEDCTGQLSRLEKYEGKAKRRGWTIVIAVPVVFGIGYGIGALTN